jgi:hypothetical protein
VKWEYKVFSGKACSVRSAKAQISTIANKLAKAGYSKEYTG